MRISERARANTSDLRLALPSLLGSTIVAQLLLIATTPLLARLYAPAAFGLYGAYSAALTIGLAVASLKLELGIPGAKSRAEAELLGGLAFRFVVLTAVAFGAFAAVAAPWLNLVDLRYSGVIGAALLFGLLGAGALQVVTYLAGREGTHRLIVRGRVVLASSQGLGQVGFGYLAFGGPVGLVIGDAFGRVVGACAATSRDTRRALVRPLPISDGLAALARSRELPMRLTPAALLGIGAAQFTLLAVPIVFGGESAGHYFMAFRLLALPGMVLGLSLAQSIHFRGARDPQQSTPRAVAPIAGKLLTIASPQFLLLAMCAGWVFPVVLGSEWRESGVLAGIMAPQMLGWTVASALSPLAILQQRTRDPLAAGGVDLLGRALGLALGWWMQSLLLAVGVWTLSGAILAGWSISRCTSVGALRAEPWKPLIVSCVIAASGSLAARGVSQIWGLTVGVIVVGLTACLAGAVSARHLIARRS